MPDGTYITLPRPGINILDETGRFIELGDWAGLAQAAKINPRLAGDIEGMATYLPRAEIPNYTLSAPAARGPALHIDGNSTTVEFSTPWKTITAWDGMRAVGCLCNICEVGDLCISQTCLFIRIFF